MNKQKLTWFILLLCHHTLCENSSKEDLSGAEAKDGLEIVKSIKKINNDGSYTIGYESDDGSFKIESRDVLGNVKGTYGYIDEKGEVKRVSYSSSNLTESNTDIPSVVQRIPKGNKTTKKPSVLLYNPTTPATPTSSTSKRRFTTQSSSTSSTTAKNKATTTDGASIVYATSAPLRSALHPRPLLRATTAPLTSIQRLEGQLIRPEIYSSPSTDLPIIRRLALKNQLPYSEATTPKPVAVASELRSNVLRRQLHPENNFDSRHHALSLQQGFGEDAEDVYSASITTGAPRPLFTTTHRPRLLPSVRAVVEKPHSNHVLNDLDNRPTTEYADGSSTTEVAVTQSNNQKVTPTYVQNIQPPLIAVRHPYYEGVVLVPADQVRAQEQHPQYILPNGQAFKAVHPTSNPNFVQSPTPFYLSRQAPVQFDQRDYHRPLPSQIFTPAPLPLHHHIPSPHRLNYEANNVDEDVDNIKPPVSTREFQKLLELLILRQKRLESANALINAQREREVYQPQHYRGGRPLFVQKHDPYQHYAHPEHARRNENGYQLLASFSPMQQGAATRRVPRLLHAPQVKEEGADDEYLPPEIREMLLLRMLQLAINPSLPLQPEDAISDGETAESSEHEVKQPGVRNVEILGEVDDEVKPAERSKRFRGNAKSYYKR
ncbi:uncharacterized protein LOC116166526 [Photinus pyralis]|uniref:uncharacterized protein LOC116166526 n=1 Tax=Photinus pyralis TaxID=7054 RepID=UPI001267332C|nr:uncharacterized protein LOC116166526 [Photinus pyralis]